MKALPVFKLSQTELRPGTTLIEASAGTGKTYTIAGLFLRLIVEQDLAVDQILVVTYTVAATEELRNRIRQTLARARAAFEREGAGSDPFLAALVKTHQPRSKDLVVRLTGALDGFDQAPIYTIHGFCQRVLKDRAFETGSLFDTELVTDQTRLLRQLVEDFWRKHFYSAGKVPVLFALRDGLTPERLLPLIRDSLPHPSLKLISAVDGEAIESLAARLEDVFSALREVWRADRHAIRSHFGSNARWANSPYNDDGLMADACSQVDRCLGAAEFPPSALDALHTFRTSAIAAKVAKKARLPAPSHRFFDLCEELHTAKERYLMGLKLQALRHVEQELPRRKEELKIQFFDDLLKRLHAALAGKQGPALATQLRRQYHAALIDEFQDTDPLQYDIFRRVFAGSETCLFLIGDPKQAIYGFRGADIFTYLKASRQADHAYTLKENWRSESGLVRALNTVFGNAVRPFVFEDIRFQPVEARGEADQHPLKRGDEAQPPLQLWFWRRTCKVINKGDANQRLPSVVASEIIALLDGKTTLGNRPLLPEDLAVLVPDNYQAGLVQAALSERQVPSVLYTTASLFDSRELVEMQRVLAAIADPTRESQLMASLATDMLGYSGSQIQALGTRDTALQEILERFRSYLDLWIQRGFIQMFRSFMERERVRPRLLALPYGERRMTNLLHLAEVLHRACSEYRLGVAGLLKWMAEQRDGQDQPDDEHQLRLETDEKAVKLVTIHKSKGLEYPVVFCPFSWKGAKLAHGGEEQVIFHQGGDGELARDLGGPDEAAHKQQALVECLAQEVRLLYVALTRAKHRCYFAWGAFRDAATSAPAALLHPAPSSDPDPVTALKEHFGKLDDDRLLEDLQALAGASADAGGSPVIAVGELPEPTAAAFATLASPGPAPKHRRFTGIITRDWRISSFTSLTANRSEELPDHDAVGAEGKDGSASRPELPSGIHAFPAGAKPGTCLHKILEQLDFNHWDQPATRDLVREQLRAHGLLAADFEHVVFEMLGRVMAVPLAPEVPGLALANVSAAQRLHELEFYFPLQKIFPRMLHQLLRQRPRLGADASKAEPEGFSFTPVQGMLKGFIDLVFEFQGRFYIADWKSNRLGDGIEAYAADALSGEIARHHYYLQYQLYTVALDRYLRLRVPDYCYEKHFGGVFYVFLRGVDPARPELGIHRDRLEESFVRKLDQLLTGGSGGQGP